MEFPAAAPPPSNNGTIVKVALTNDQCGALIGKAGSVIISLQRAYGVIIKAGTTDELFPGTPFRAAIIRGNPNGVGSCLQDVVKVLHQDHLLRHEQSLASLQGAEAAGAGSNAFGQQGPGAAPAAAVAGRPAAADFIVRMLIPETAAGAVIGKGGSVIREMCDRTGAAIRLSPPEHRVPGVTERIVAISSDTGRCVAAAVTAVFWTLASDPGNLLYANPTVVYARFFPDQQPPPHHHHHQGQYPGGGGYPSGPPAQGPGYGGGGGPYAGGGRGGEMVHHQPAGPYGGGAPQQHQPYYGHQGSGYHPSPLGYPGGPGPAYGGGHGYGGGPRYHSGPRYGGYAPTSSGGYGGGGQQHPSPMAAGSAAPGSGYGLAEPSSAVQRSSAPAPGSNSMSRTSTPASGGGGAAGSTSTSAGYGSVNSSSSGGGPGTSSVAAASQQQPAESTPQSLEPMPSVVDPTSSLDAATMHALVGGRYGALAPAPADKTAQALTGSAALDVDGLGKKLSALNVNDRSAENPA